MNLKHTKIIRLFPALTLLFLLSGCLGTSPPARFYTMTSGEHSLGSEVTMSGKLIQVGPVEIPSYLDRPQIITRTGQNELVHAEFDRWAGSLSEEITGLLVYELNRCLTAEGFVVVPWRLSLNTDQRLAYRIPIRVIRFEGTPGKDVVLSAIWDMVVKNEDNEKSLLAVRSAISADITEKSYESLVSAMAKAVEKLGSEIAVKVIEQDGLNK